MKKLILIFILIFIICLPTKINAEELLNDSDSCSQLKYNILDPLWREKMEYITCNGTLRDPAACAMYNEYKACDTSCACIIPTYCDFLHVGAQCVSDNEIIYTPISRGDTGPGIKANKIVYGSCRATVSAGKLTEKECRLESISSDNACYVYDYIDYSTSEDTTWNGSDDTKSYQLGYYGYYTYKRKNIIKKPPSTPPSGYSACYSSTHSIPYSYDKKYFYYDCNSLSYICYDYDDYSYSYFTSGGYCTTGDIESKTFYFPKNDTAPDTKWDSPYTWGRYDTDEKAKYYCYVKAPSKEETVSVDFGTKYSINGQSGYCLGSYNNCVSGYKDYVMDMDFGSSAEDKALIGIIRAGSSDYLATLIALIFRANPDLPLSIDPFLNDEREGNAFYENLIYNTLLRINYFGYLGTFEGTGYFPEILYQSGTSTLSKAINLYKTASSKNNSSHPSINLSGSSTIGDSEVDFTIIDKDKIEFKTSFNMSTNISVSANNGVRIDKIEKRKKSDGLYVTVTVVDARASEDSGGLCYNNIKDFKITVTGSGSGATTVIQYVRKYVSMTYRKDFILTYDPIITDIYSKSFTINVKCNNCDPTPLTTTKTAADSCNIVTGVGGKVSFADPDEYQIIKACATQKKPYEYVIYNQYCNIYCTEKINLELMPKVTGTAGRFFKYELPGRVNNQNINTALATSTLTCVSEIRYNKWKINYDSASASEKAQLMVELKNCNLYQDNGSDATSLYDTIVDDYEGNYSSDMTIKYQEKGLEDTPKISYDVDTTFTSNTLWCTEIGTTLDNRICITSAGFSSTQTKDGSIPTNTYAKMSTVVSVDYYQAQDYYTQAFTGNISLTPKENYGQMEDYVYPLNLTTKTGLYDITLTYSDIGKASRQVINAGTYKCKYQVNNSIVNYDDGSDGGDGNDGKGSSLGFFFRTIDLENVFPTDRVRGTNWASADVVINNIEDLGNDVWSKNVEYSFTLTPSNIKAIKDYNTSKENLNGNGYFDMSLYGCEYTAQGFNNCKSLFLSDQKYTTDPNYNGRND